MKLNFHGYSIQFFYLDKESLEESNNTTGTDPSNTNESSCLKYTLKNSLLIIFKYIFLKVKRMIAPT